MSMANMTPNTVAQHLLDQRLDAIDRALLGFVPRNDRLAMVALVETRIRELAAAQPALEANLPGSMEWLTLPDPAQFDSAGWTASRMTMPPAFGPAAAGSLTAPYKKRSRLAIAAGVLGIVALVLLFVTPVTYFIVESLGDVLGEVIAISLLGAHLAAVTVGGVAAVALGIAALVSLKRRKENLMGHAWAITGLCTGPLPIFAGGLVALFFGVQLMASQMITVQAVSSDDAVPAESPPAWDAANSNSLPDPVAPISASPPSTNPGIVGPRALDVGARQPEVQPAGHDLPEYRSEQPDTDTGGLNPPTPRVPVSSPPSPLPRTEPQPQSAPHRVPQPRPAPEPASPPESIPTTPQSDIGE